MSGDSQRGYEQPPIDGKAIGSLVCGILGLLCILPVIGPIVAVILGHLALGSIKRSEGQLGGQGVAVGGLVTGYLGLVWMLLIVPAILAGMLLPALSKAREKARQVSCAGNLKQIGLGLLMYSGEHSGYFPLTPAGNNFEPLNTEQILTDGKVYACPSSSSAHFTARNSDYVYVGSGIMDDADGATVIAYDKSGNHPRNQWMNALFADGHVEGAKPDGSKGWNTYR